MTTMQQCMSHDSLLTEEVVGTEEIVVPYLHGEDRGKMTLCLGQTVEVLLQCGASIKRQLSRGTLNIPHQLRGILLKYFPPIKRQLSSGTLNIPKR